MIAYKLFRKLKNGSITSLFINKRERLEFNRWYKAQCYPTKGFSIRPYFHCTKEPIAPHLSNKNRIWLMVEIEDYTEIVRPNTQGGIWYLANKMKILKD